MLLSAAASIDLAPALAHFAAHGWARVGPALDEAGARALRERSDELMLGQVSYPGLFFQLDAPSGRYEDLTYGRGWEGPSLGYRKLEKLELDPLFRAWIDNPLFERIVRALEPDGESGFAIYRAVLFNKGPAGGSILPWHQDGGRFWGVDRDPTIQIWTALDDAPEGGGCLEVIPGSHRAGLVTPDGGVVPPDRVGDAEARAIAVPARAGEVLLVHNHVWHRSRAGRPGQPRRALSICYMSAATRCLRRKRAPREFTRVFVAPR